MSIASVRLGYLVSFGGGRDAKDVVSPGGTIPIYGSGGRFGCGDNFLYEGESVLFGRKGTVDRPQYVAGKFWVVDTAYYTVIGGDVFPKYLYHWATTVDFDLLSTNTAVPSVTSADLSRLE